MTMAELLQPSDGSMVEFWCHRMSQQGKAGTGIRGWFRGGLFWSWDNADHYAPGEVTYWLNVHPRAVIDELTGPEPARSNDDNEQ